MTRDKAVKEMNALLLQKQELERSLRQQGLDYRNNSGVLQLQRQYDNLRDSL